MPFSMSDGHHLQRIFIIHRGRPLTSKTFMKKLASPVSLHKRFLVGIHFRDLFSRLVERQDMHKTLAWPFFTHPVLGG